MKDEVLHFSALLSPACEHRRYPCWDMLTSTEKPSGNLNTKSTNASKIVFKQEKHRQYFSSRTLLV